MLPVILQRKTTAQHHTLSSVHLVYTYQIQLWTSKMWPTSLHNHLVPLNWLIQSPEQLINIHLYKHIHTPIHTIYTGTYTYFTISIDTDTIHRHWHTYGWTDRHTNRQTDTHTHKQTDRHTHTQHIHTQHTHTTHTHTTHTHTTHTHNTHTQHTHTTHTHTTHHIIFTCEKLANAGSANSGACPMSSWQTSGSGVYHGMDGCLMYWVEWKTRNAKPARKSRDDSRPATGLSWNPVHSLRYLETTSSCGILSSLYSTIYRDIQHYNIITLTYL